MSYVFLFRAYPDIDNIAPLAWKLLERGEQVHAVISPGYDAESDHHLEFLRTYERFHLHQPGSAGGPMRSWLRATFPYALILLRRLRASVLVVEWGSGPRISGPRGPEALPALLRRVAGSVAKAHRKDPQEIRSNLVLAAALMRVPTVCVPHGVSIKLEGVPVIGRQAKRVARGEKIDWRDRSRFAAFVYDTEDHLRQHLELAAGDPANLEAWGSMRWDPGWFTINRRLAPELDWPAAPGALRVAFMVPKWRNRASAETAAELLAAIQQLDFVSLAVKGHPRKEGSLLPLRESAGLDWARIRDISHADSVAIIAAADVVIDVGSSIGLEVVMQGKSLVNPAFLHELTTMFDVLPGSCVRSDDVNEVVDYLREHHAGRRHQISEEVLAELLRRCVYASREPFDVVARYADGVTAIAVASGRNGR